MFVHKEFTVHSGMNVSFFDMTDEVLKTVADSGVQNGTVLVYSQHTSCSVFIQEESEDVTYRHVQLILQDTVNVLEKIIPTCQYEGQYLHPGPIHTEHAMAWRDEKSEWLLNTDAHLRSVVMGRSQTIPVVDGKPILGEFGRVYFVDFDQTRGRDRVCRVQVMGE